MLENTYINLINKNIRTLNKANEIMGDIQQAVAYNDVNSVYALSLDYERTVERLVPLSRDLVICQGRKESEQAVKQAIQNHVPVEINFTKEGWFVLSIPALLPRKEKGNAQYIREIVHDALSEYCKDKNIRRFGKCILIYEHIYDHRIPKREWRDHDNIEINTVTDMIALFILRDDSPYVCSHVYVSKAGEQNRTNIYVVPETDFDTWRRKGGFGMTIHLNANCQAFEILKVVAIIGEFPLHRLGMLGNRRMYRATVARMMEEQTYLNDYTKETVTARVLTIVGKGKRRGIRLLKGAETLLKWTKLYEYYDTIFGQNNFSGGEKHRDRNFKIAETLAMCRGAEFAYNPAHLPDLSEGAQTLPVEFQEQPCFYTARAIKGDKDYEMKETVFTRATGAFFFNGQFITLYNIGNDMAKLWENSEAKMKDNLFIINRNNGGRYLEKSPACIMLTENEMHVVNTLRYVYNKRANKHKDYTQSSFYRHVYAIPLSSDGMRILRLFHLRDWQELLARKICPKERGWLTVDNRFVVDNGKTFYYNFLDCDIASLLYMKKQMKKGTQVDAIVCFEHQIPFIQELFSKKINIRCFSIGTIEKILGITPEKEANVEKEDEQNGDT